MIFWFLMILTAIAWAMAVYSHGKANYYAGKRDAYAEMQEGIGKFKYDKTTGVYYDPTQVKVTKGKNFTRFSNG